MSPAPKPPGRQLARVVARFAARPEKLAELHAAFDTFFLAARAARAPLRAADRGPLLTAGAEIAANIIVHACRGVPDSEIQVTLVRLAHRVEISFEDVGEPYVYAADTSGWGLRLARASVHALDYHRHGEVNRWHLVRETGLPVQDDGEL